MDSNLPHTYIFLNSFCEWLQGRQILHCCDHLSDEEETYGQHEEGRSNASTIKCLLSRTRHIFHDSLVWKKINCNWKSDDCKAKRSREKEKNEEFVVMKANTISNPRTVMIHS